MLESAVAAQRSSESSPRPVPAGVGAEVDQERKGDEDPLETVNMMPGAPVPERRIGEGRPRQEEESEQRNDPAAEGAAEQITEDPQDDEHKPW